MLQKRLWYDPQFFSWKWQIKRNPFLTLLHGNVFSTAYTHQCLASNYPVLFKMYENYLELPESNDNYVRSKIKQRYNNQLKSTHTREKVDILIYVATHFWKRPKHHKIYFNNWIKWIYSLQLTVYLV